MSTTTDPRRDPAMASASASQDPSALPRPDEVQRQLSGKKVCPFCGSISEPAADTTAAVGIAGITPTGPGACPRCRMEDTPATRQATRLRIGPWHVLQSRNPAAPGMKFDTLVSLVRRGKITPRSIVRGPTTHQMWRFAAKVKGISREWGLCYSCGNGVDTTTTLCPHCNRIQEPPIDPDVLLEPASTITAATRATAPDEAGMPTPTAPLAGPSDRRPLVDLEIATPVMPERETIVGSTDLPAPATEPAPPDHEMSEAFNLGKPEAPETRPQMALVTAVPAPAPDRARPTGQILSAADLATAFNLNTTAPGTSGASGNMAQPAAPRRKRPGRAIAALFLMGLAGAAIALSMRPQWRDQSLTWARNTYAVVVDSLKSSRQPPRAASPAAPQPAPPVAPLAKAPILAPAQSVEPTTAAIAEPPSSLKPADSVVAVAPSSSPQWEELLKSAATTPPVRTKTPPAESTKSTDPDPPAPAPQPADAPDALARARTLWRSAIDAEHRQDYVAAVRAYEQIKQLPSDAWPGGLDVKLEIAKRRVK
ncbi:MAG: hypothetical protein ACREIT_05615 [Tepidisphaeraceae bacterium]